MQKQHFVFFNQYYPPDLAPTGMMLRDVAEEMVTQGSRVTIICSKGGYSGGDGSGGLDESEKKGVRVIRVPGFRFGRNSSFGKLCDYLSFYFFAFWFGLMVGGRPSRFVALTTPPYLSVLARLLSKLRGATHGHWVMDLYPDVMVAHGLLKERSFKAKVLLAISRWGFGGTRNQVTVSLGPDMAERLERRHGVGNGIWIPLWSAVQRDEPAEASSAQLRRERGWDGKTVFLYSGNMGLGHRLEDFLLLAKENRSNSKVVFAFYGGGKRRREVASFIEKNPGARVELGDYVPEEMLTTHLLSADVHLASLEPDWDGCMVPSKIQGIFASARPVLFLGSETCAIGQWIVGANAGWVVAPDEHERIRECFGETLDDSLRMMKGQNALQVSNERFDRCHNRDLVVEQITRKS